MRAERRLFLIRLNIDFPVSFYTQHDLMMLAKIELSKEEEKKALKSLENTRLMESAEINKTRLTN
jgi:hypothetical protein